VGKKENADEASKFHSDNARQVFNEFSKLRGTALKIAQQLSLDQGVLPDEFADVMSEAQYSVPPINKALARSIIKKELGEYPEKFKRVVIMNTFLPTGKQSSFMFKLWVWFARYHPSLPVGRLIQFATAQHLSNETIAAYNAPFPSRKYKSGARAFPSLVPSDPNDPGVQAMKKARETLSEWTKPALVLFSDKDPIMSGLEGFFYELIPSSGDQQKIIIENAGHFLQEVKGQEIAGYINQFMKGTLTVR
jgi:hypothetical protein